MLFNSIDFAVFLPVVFILYWSLNNRSLKLQNLFVVAASYTFYCWWDWRYLGLVILSTVVGYGTGLGIARARGKGARRVWLLASIVVNLGLLAFFKYFDFFVDGFGAAFTFFGGPVNTRSLGIVLPIGISFYTFQTLGYSIDVYRKRIEPTTDYIAFSAFHSFFPQLVAGPIERATTLLPQFYVRRRFAYAEAVDGLRQILWGLFKKVVIADSCARFANAIFNNSSEYSGSTLLLGALFFAIQIYGDFSGYSDIAIGTGRLFGIRLMQNFAFPYFSRDIAEFWRRWHISLSTWFRDYLYIPLGGSRGGTWLKVRNVFIIFLASGLWHGANWTFVIWGALNALILPAAAAEEKEPGEPGDRGQGQAASLAARAGRDGRDLRPDGAGLDLLPRGERGPRARLRRGNLLPVPPDQPRLPGRCRRPRGDRAGDGVHADRVAGQGGALRHRAGRIQLGPPAAMGLLLPARDADSRLLRRGAAVHLLPVLTQ